MIECRHVSHAFGAVAVLDDVSITVDEGKFVSLIGPSGCGKTTLLRLLAGLVPAQSGTIATDPVAYQPQRDALLPWRRVLANATLGAEIAGVERTEARRRAAAQLERFGLAGFERAWPHELSGGMRQRVALLRTFLMPRSTLLLDEPFGALDALTRRDLYRWLEVVWRDDPRTVLLVTHDIDEALVLSDTVIVMSKRPGRTLAAIDVDRPRPRVGLAAGADAALRQRVLAALEAG